MRQGYYRDCAAGGRKFYLFADLISEPPFLNPPSPPPPLWADRRNGTGDGGSSGGDRSVGAGAALSALLCGHHSGELPVAVRPRGTVGEAPLCRDLGGGLVLPVLWIILQPPLPLPHGAGLRLHALPPPALWYLHLLRRLRLPHRMVITQISSLDFYCQSMWIWSYPRTEEFSDQAQPYTTTWRIVFLLVPRCFSNFCWDGWESHWESADFP